MLLAFREDISVPKKLREAVTSSDIKIYYELRLKLVYLFTKLNVPLQDAILIANFFKADYQLVKDFAEDYMIKIDDLLEEYELIYVILHYSGGPNVGMPALLSPFVGNVIPEHYNEQVFLKFFSGEYCGATAAKRIDLIKDEFILLWSNKPNDRY